MAFGTPDSVPGLAEVVITVADTTATGHEYLPYLELHSVVTSHAGSMQSAIDALTQKIVTLLSSDPDLSVTAQRTYPTSQNITA